MRINRYILTLVSVLMVCAASAQTTADRKQSFAEYRKSMLDNYQEYRKKLLDDYAQFLDGIWDDFTKFKGEERDSIPKPPTQPILVDETPSVPKTDHKNNEPILTSKKEESPAQPASPVISSKQESKVEPIDVTSPNDASPKFDFMYYGMNIQVPEITVRIKDALQTPREYAQQWDKLARGGEAVKVAANLDKKSKEMRLNPYLTYVMVKNWVDASYPSCQATSRMSMAHFLLANMGYDVRISLTGNGEPVLLMPSQQTIYSRPYLMIDNRRYYIFPDNDANIKSLDFNFSTCRLPKDADLGKELDLQIHNLNIPYKAKPYAIEYAGMKLEGTVNANLKPMLKNYPQMDMPNYSVSMVDHSFRDDIVRQVSEQLDGMDQLAAVNKLLQFIQKGFAYATDHAFHGYEKPYFFEEMMLYDKCDCEDRAIFYTYLLWNVLGVKNHMINYPGHESVAVCLEQPVQGTSYQSGGNTFYISDPTYIGSRTGQCMPSYEKTAPRVDYEYK